MNGDDDDLDKGFQPVRTLGADGRLEGASTGGQPPPAGPAHPRREEPALELDDHRSLRRAKVEEPALELAYATRQRDASQLRPALELSTPPTSRGGGGKWLVLGFLLIGGLIAWRLIRDDTSTLAERAREAGAQAVQHVGQEIDALRPANDPLGNLRSDTEAEVQAGSEGAWKLRKLIGTTPTGVLTIMSQPAGAEILINGRHIGYTPWAGDRLWPTGTEVELKLEGHRPWSETIQANGDVTLNAKLRR